MKFIKKHRYAIITALVFLILIVLAALGLKEVFFPDDNKSVYGTRIDGIEDVPIKDSVVSEIKSKLTTLKFVKKVDYNLEGRRMNFVIIIENDTNLTTAYTTGDTILECLTDEIKNYYDIQIFLKEEKVDEDEEIYPKIGYKHKTSLNFVW